MVGCRWSYLPSGSSNCWGYRLRGESFPVIPSNNMLILRLVLAGTFLPYLYIFTDYRLTVGGGYGFLTGRHGLTIDNLIGATVVVADGQILEANEQENPDVSPTQLTWHRPSGIADSSALLGNSRWRIQLWYRDQFPTRTPPYSCCMLVRKPHLHPGQA